MAYVLNVVILGILKRYFVDVADVAHRLTRRKVVGTIFGPAALSETLNIGLSMLDLNLTQMWTLKLFFERCNYVGLVKFQFVCNFSVRG